MKEWGLDADDTVFLGRRLHGLLRFAQIFDEGV